MLAALLVQHRGRVVFMDEPDLHLHPVTETQAAQRMLSGDSDESQYVVVTHSPYMIPPGSLERVRRVYYLADKHRSDVSKPFSDAEIEDLELRRRGRSPEEMAFLF